jgi:hypothetical protein
LSGALQTLWESYKNSRVESENEVKAGVGVDNGVDDGIDIAVGVNVGGGDFFCYWIED